jgi:hypothetical protein
MSPIMEKISRSSGAILQRLGGTELGIAEFFTLSTKMIISSFF